MDTFRGYVYRLYPTPQQDDLLARTAGTVRFVYNLALEQRRIWGRKPYAGGKTRAFRYQGMSKELSQLRKDVDWIGAVSQTAQIQCLMDLDRAFTNFFEGRAGYPSPRKRGRGDAFRHVGREVQVRKINSRWSEVRIPKIGWVRYRDTRPLPAQTGEKPAIRNATVRRTAEGWEISIMIRASIDQAETPRGAIGIDRGVAIPYALSNGDVVGLPDTIQKRKASIRRAQKAMSRRKRGSKRYARARSRLARLKARDARCRAHVAHVLTRRLARQYGLVAIEDLKIRNMTASARGTIDDPGSQVRQKSGLNRSILNVGWHSFEVKLAYKLEETGGILAKVPAPYTSRTCSACGHVDAESRKNQAVFVCTSCGAAANADTNAAKVILSRALACDDTRRWNAPALDVEGKASAPCETSTQTLQCGLNGRAEAQEIPVSSGRGRC